jgi:hypothetical protein
MNVKITNHKKKAEISQEYIYLDILRIKNAVKKLQNYRTSGPGRIPAVLIKHGTEKLFEMFEKCINGGDWKIACVTPIYKKGKRNVCSNYGDNSVISTFSKIHGHIIKGILEEEYQDMLREEQAGFRVGRYKVDNLYCVTQLIEKRLEVLQETYLVFVDLKKAYDSIPISKLWEAFENTGISAQIIQAVKNLLTGSVSKRKIVNKLSDGFPVTEGPRQGCCFSPSPI